MWISNYVVDGLDGAVVEGHRSPLFYFVIFLCVGICFASDYFVIAWKTLVAPTPSDFIRECFLHGGL